MDSKSTHSDKNINKKPQLSLAVILILVNLSWQLNLSTSKAHIDSIKFYLEHILHLRSKVSENLINRQR